MIQLKGVLTAISPLHLGSGRARGTFQPTLSYIPGRTLRGMLGYYLYSEDRELYDALEIDDETAVKIRFKNAYPLHEGDAAVASPLSFQWCKKCGALMRDTECTSSVEGRCCLHEGKKHTGLITRASLENRRIDTPELHRQISTKCPITRTHHTTMDEDWRLKPYHIESLPEGTTFQLRLMVEEEFVEDIIKALKAAGIFCGLGGFRSRGYGSVRFDRIETIDVNTRIEERAEELGDTANPLLVANSQMILKSNNNESIIGFDETLDRYIKKTLQAAGVNSHVTPRHNTAKITQSIARGWSLKNQNTLSELIPCIGMGSCVRVEGEPRALAVLETYGIGEMTSCGYGDVYVTGDVR
jgi:CRISPR/Cas system CSM-associated protein Csm3 (group 7 of RAMP superfamily)